MGTTVTVINPKEFGVEPQIAEGFVKGLNVVRQERELLIEEFNRVSKLEITPDTIQEYRALRLKVQKNRTQGTGKWHKNMKEIPLRQGKLIDAIRNNEDSINLGMEEVLMNGEKHYEILEKEKLAKIQAERVAQITHYIEDADQRDFTKFEEDEFEAFLAMKKKSYEDAIAEAKKTEAERIAKEKADEAEREAQRKENIRLKAEAEAKEKELEKERAEALKKQQAIEAKAEKERLEAKAKQDAIDAKIAKEREEERLKAKAVQDKIIEEARIEREKELAKRQKLEAELKDKEEKELFAKEQLEKAKLADEKKAELLAKAPVKERLTLWVNSFELPPTTDFNNETAQDITTKFKAFKKWAKTQINNI